MEKNVINIILLVITLLMVVGGIAAFATYEHHKEKED